MLDSFCARRPGRRPLARWDQDQVNLARFRRLIAEQVRLCRLSERPAFHHQPLLWERFKHGVQRCLLGKRVLARADVDHGVVRDDLSCATEDLLEEALVAVGMRKPPLVRSARDIGISLKPQ